MEPRLDKSKKWTSIPTELLEQICEVFSDNFQQQTQSGSFLAEGRIYPSELLVRVGYLATGEIKQNNFEISIEYSVDKDNMMKMVHLAIDCIGSLMAQFFDEPSTDFPRQWQKFEVEDRDVFLRYSIINSELEAEADRLLGEDSDEELVGGEDLDEELKAKISMLGLDDDEDEPTTH